MIPLCPCREETSSSLAERREELHRKLRKMQNPPHWISQQEWEED
nr:MAG TPA: hypothetical protein [Caudoviricetes sp.]